MKAKIYKQSWLLIFLCVPLGLQAQDIVGYSSPFTLDSKVPAVVVTYPNSNTYFASSNEITVNWSATDDNLKANPISIKLVVQPNNQVYELANNLGNTGAATLYLPDINTNQARIKISAEDSFGNIGLDESNNFFSVYDLQMFLGSAYFLNTNSVHYESSHNNIGLDKMIINLNLSNNSSIEFNNILFDAKIDNIACLVNFKPGSICYDNNNDGLLDELLTGSSVNLFIESPSFSENFENKTLEVKILQIDGVAADISLSGNISMFCIRNTFENNRPFAMNFDTYGFNNDNITDLSELTFETFLQILIDNGFNFNQTALHLFSLLFTINGNCFGMSTTVGSYFSYPSSKPLTADVFQWPLSNFEVRNQIYKYQVRQLLYFYNTWFSNLEIEDVKSRFNQNEPVVLVIEKPGSFLKKDKHAILANKLTIVNNEAYIFCYENNYKNRYMEAKYDMTSSDFIYTNLTGVYWANPKMMPQSSMNPLAKDDELLEAYYGALPSDIYNSGMKLYAVAGPVNMYVKNSAGNRAGFLQDGQPVYEIEDATVSRHPTFTVEHDSVTMIYVPMDDYYTVHMYPYQDGEVRFEVYDPVEQQELVTAVLEQVEVEEENALSFDDDNMEQLNIDLNGNGVIDQTVKMEVTQISNIAEVKKQQPAVTVTPNPNKGMFTFQFGNDIQQPFIVKVFNSAGTEVFKKAYNAPGNSEYEINLKSMPKGVYHLYFITGEKVETTKIVII
jgi:hypothetical protein